MTTFKANLVDLIKGNVGRRVDNSMQRFNRQVKSGRIYITQNMRKPSANTAQVQQRRANGERYSIIWSGKIDEPFDTKIEVWLSEDGSSVERFIAHDLTKPGYPKKPVKEIWSD